jgi:hypothetical protein
MRDIPTGYLNELDNVRTIGTRFTFRDKRLVFNTFSPGDDPPTLSHANHWDAEGFGWLPTGGYAGFLRVARNSDGKLCWQAVYDHDADPPWDGGSGNTTAWNVTDHVLLPCKPGIARLGTSQAMYIYAAMDLGAATPHIVRFNWSPSGLTGPWEISQIKLNNFAIGALPDYYEFPDNTGLAFAGLEHEPNGAYRFVMQFFPYDTVRDINYAVIQYFETIDQKTWRISEFPGAVYGDMQHPYRFDAEFYDGQAYIFTTDSTHGRPLLIKTYPKLLLGAYQINEWSDAEYIFPLDVLDDTSYMKLGAVTIIDDKLWVTGRMKRGENIEMDVYMYGDGHFSVGRDMYIANSDEIPDSGAGKLILLNDGSVYYIGHGIYAKADATSLVGVDTLDKRLVTRDVNNFTSSIQANSSWTMNTLLSAELEHDAIRKNAEMVVDVGLQDDSDVWHWAQIGVFGVDAIVRDYFSSGNDRRVLSRGAGIKRLSQWTSDAFYDYWSQAKLAADPAELSEVIRASGQWSTDTSVDEEPIRLDRLNEVGILYTSSKASRNGQCSASFYAPEEAAWELQIHSGRFGVGINYYRESRAQAAERLEVETGDVTDSEFGDNGLFAVYEPAREEIVLYAVHDGVWHELTSDGYTVDYNTWFWIMIKFNEGWIEVWTGETTSGGYLSWSQQIAYRFDTNVATGVNVEPWFRDQRGRGAVVIENVSAHSTTPGFTSTSSIIPVASTAPFPTSGRVIVDSEIIDYDGKVDVGSTITSLSLTWAEGKTYLKAPHNNDLWTDVRVFDIAFNENNAGAIDLGRYSNYSLMCLQALTKPYGRQRIDKARVVMKRVGSTPKNVYAWIVNDDIDNWGWTPAYGVGRKGQPIISQVSAPVAGHTISTEYDWVEFDFTDMAEPDRWLWEDYPKGYFLLITTIPTYWVNSDYGFRYYTNWGAYADASNYYSLRLDDTVSATMGIFLNWSTAGWRSSWNMFGHDTMIPLQIDGVANTPAVGTEIYFEGLLPERARGALDNAALVVTDGPGAGTIFKITDYDWRAPDQWVTSRAYFPPDNVEDHVNDPAHGEWVTPDMSRIFVDRNPYGSIGEGSTFAIYSSLVIDERGLEDTTATSHPTGTVSLYSPLSVAIDEVKYFSGEPDMRIEDMIGHLATRISSGCQQSVGMAL